MEHDVRQSRLETEAIVVGYAMSRLDRRYLSERDCSTWRQAFQQAADALNVRRASFKNLRDEFDPLHANPRQGWHLRSLRASRQRVMLELQEVSDDALSELVNRILKREDDATLEAIDSLAVVTHVAYNVAERLLTGRRAEEHFLTHSDAIAGVRRSSVIDFRQSARGFDFGVDGAPELAIEVKGLKQMNGGIQFTDREWSEAQCRRENYWLVVVGNLAAEPVARVIRDPHCSIPATCRYQKSVTAAWHSTVSLLRDSQTGH